MIFTYNGVPFPANTVRLEGVGTNTNYEGLMPVGVQRSWNIYGRLFGNSNAELNQKIYLLEQLFASEGGTAGFFYDTGAATAHSLGGAGSRCGVKVTTRPTYENAVGNELGMYRSWRCVMTADYDVNLPNLVVKFSETITVYGDGSELTVYLPCIIGKPIKQILKQYTPVKVVQTGTIVGRYRHVMPEEWVQEAVPGFRQGPLCTFGRGTAELRDGLAGNPVERNFPVSYTWVFEMPGYIPPRYNGWRN